MVIPRNTMPNAWLARKIMRMSYAILFADQLLRSKYLKKGSIGVKLKVLKAFLVKYSTDNYAKCMQAELG